MTNSLSFNSYDFAAYGAYLLEGFELPQQVPAINTSSVVGMHGGYLRTSKYGIRDIEVPLIFKGYANTAAFYTAVDNLNSILDISIGQKQLKFDYCTTRYLLAIASSKLKVKKIGLTAADASVSFKVVDPFWYSTTETSSAKTITGTPQTLTETPGGSVDCWPVYTIVNAAVIAISTSIKLENLSITGGRAITWVTPVQIEVGDIIEIDSATQNIKLNGVSSIATIATNYQFPPLLPTLNILRLTGVTSAAMTITYRARYL